MEDSKQAPSGGASSSSRKKADASLDSVMQLLAAQSAKQEECIQRDQSARVHLKQRIVVDSKRNILLERALLRLERKIQERVLERISSEDVLRSESTLDKMQKELEVTPELSEILQRYGNFIFFLQTDTKYLAHLLRQMDNKQVDQLVSFVVFTVFANPHDAREENLLLALIRNILTQRWEECTDVTTYLRENSAAPKLLTAYTKRDPPQKVLREVLVEPMRELMKKTTLKLEINPGKVLEKMLAAGKGTDLSNGVDSPEIVKLIAERVKSLEELCDSFLQPIYKCKLPMGVRLICKVLRELAESRFPDDKQLGDSLVGGFIFLRFFNPAIIDPKTVNPDDPPRVPSTVRRNMVLVAKVLQNLSNGLLFGDKEKFMNPMNPYLKRQQPLIREFFSKITQVKDLAEHLEVDSYLEEVSPTEPFVYMSVREMLYIHELAKRNLDVITDNDPDDPIRLVLRSLEEHKARERCAPEEDKFVTVRVVDWMSQNAGITGPTAGGSKQTPATQLQALVLPVLQNIFKEKDLSHDVVKAGDDKGTLLKFLNRALEQAKARNAGALTEQAKRAIAKVEKADAEVVSECVNLMTESISRKDLLQEKLAEEVTRLRTALKAVEEKYSNLQATTQTYKQYLKNIRDQTYYKLGWKSDESHTEEEEKTAPSIQITDVLSTDGLIGGLLNKLQGDVCDSLTARLHDSTPGTGSSSSKTEQGSIASLFQSTSTLPGHARLEEKSLVRGVVNQAARSFWPRSTPFYSLSLKTFATVGKTCLHSMVEMVLKTLPSLGEANPAWAYNSQATAGFSWAAFFTLIPNVQLDNSEHLDVLDLLIELMAVDILAAVLQHFDNGKETGAESVLSTENLHKLTVLAFHHFAQSRKRSARKGGLKKGVYGFVMHEISNQWAIVLGQLCPFHVLEPVKMFVEHMDKAVGLTGSSSKDYTIAEDVLRGCRFMRFDPKSDQGSVGLEMYVECHLNVCKKIKSSSTSSKDIALQKAQFENLEHCLRMLDFTKCGQGRKGIMSRLFFDYVGPLYEEITQRFKHDEIKAAALRVCNVIIMHGPESFYDMTVGGYVSSMLTKGVGIDRKRSSAYDRLNCVLHFLRGGGASASYAEGADTVTCITHSNNKPLDRHGLVFGFHRRLIQKDILAVIHKKLFVDKRVAGLPMFSRTTERLVVQMACHDFEYVTDSVLPPLFNSTAKAQEARVQEQLCALRVVEILTDKRSGFSSFVLRGLKQQAQITRLTNRISALSSTVLKNVLDLVRTSDKAVGLRALSMTPTLRGVDSHHIHRDTGLDDDFLERWILLDLYDPTDELMEQQNDFDMAVFKSYEQQQHNVQLGVYYHSLRLFPEIMPEEMIQASRENCSIDGLFVGRLVCHSNPLISRTAFEGITRTMIFYPDERAQVVEAFLRTLSDGSFQKPAALATLLHHLVGLLRLWSEQIIESAMKDKTRATYQPSQSNAVSRSRLTGSVVGSMSVITQQAPVLETPSFLRWKYRADGVGLLYCAHPDKQVRAAALDLLENVREIYATWYKVQSGVDLPDPSAQSRDSFHCIADVIKVYGDEILEGAADQYLTMTRRVGDTSRPSKRQSVFGDLHKHSPSAVNKSTTGLHSLLSNYEALIPHGIGLVGRYCVDNLKSRDLDITRALVRRRLEEMRNLVGSFPQTASDQQKHLPPDFAQRWTRYHAIYFSLFGLSSHADAQATSNSLVSTSELKESEPTNVSLHDILSEYLMSYFELLGTDVVWLKEAAVVALAETNGFCMNTVVSALTKSYDALLTKKKRRKKALTLVAVIMHRLPAAAQFTRALKLQGSSIITSFKRLLKDAQAQLWAPKKLVKEKWGETQLDLVAIVKNLSGAINRLGREDPAAAMALKHWTVQERFFIFEWLTNFARTTEQSSLDDSAHADAHKAAEERKAQVSAIVRDALLQLSGLGRIIPEGKVSSVLLSTDLLAWLLANQDYTHDLLASLLCFHHRVLLPVYIDRVYLKSDQSELYFHAIAEVFSSFDTSHLSNIQRDSKIVKLMGSARLHHARDAEFRRYSRSQLGRLIHLTLLKMSSEDLQTRFAAFEMIRSVARQFVGDEQEMVLRKHRFAFESDLSTSATDAAVAISGEIASVCPEIAVLVFREAFQCLKSTPEYKDWVPRFLLPWAACIALTPMTSPVAASAPETKEAPSRKGTHHTREQSTSVSNKMLVANVHTTQNFLLQLFNLSLDGSVPVECLLPVWCTLASSSTNVMAMMQFLVAKVSDSTLEEPVPLCKKIMFALYSVKDHREFVMFTIVRYFLGVLKQNSGMWSQASLNNKNKSGMILSVLERHEAQEQADDDKSAIQKSTSSENIAIKSAHDLSNFVPSDDLPDIPAGNPELSKSASDRAAQSPARPAQVVRAETVQALLKKKEMDTPAANLQLEREHVNKSTQQMQSHLVAAMLIELLGLDPTPALSYYPIIVIYCIIHINNQEALVRDTMHQLLIRLMNAVGQLNNTTGITEPEIRVKGPSLADALQRKSLQLVWSTLHAAKVHSSPNGVVMYAQDFVSQYVQQLEASRPNSVSRIGYEALRWAVLSTDLRIANMAYVIYRGLLSPLNECCIYVLLLSLLGALKDWERQGWYLKPKSEEEANELTSQQQRKNVKLLDSLNAPTGSSIKADALTAAQVQATMILETVQAVADQLFRCGLLHRHPSLFWTAVALLRCDDRLIYDRALTLLATIKKAYVYLFSSSYQSRYSASLKADRVYLSRQGTASSSGSVSSTGLASPTLAPVQPSSTEPKANDAEMPEDFWSFSEKWNPSFEGIQPYLLEGLLHESTEENSVRIISTLTKVVWDSVVDRGPTRHLRTITAFLPIAYLQLSGQSTSDFSIADILDNLSSVIGRFSVPLRDCFARFASESTVRARNYKGISILKKAAQGTRMVDAGAIKFAESFLSEVCKLLVEAYFPQYASTCAEYLTALLRSTHLQYHPVVLKITKTFLVQPSAALYVDCFADIITISHNAVTVATAQAAQSSTSTTGVVTSVELSSSGAHASRARSLASSSGGPQGHSQKQYSSMSSVGDFAGAAADVIATVITLFNQNKKEKKTPETATPQASTATDHSYVPGQRAMPIRSLHNAIDALTHVVRCAPMLPSQEEDPE